MVANVKALTEVTVLDENIDFIDTITETMQGIGTTAFSTIKDPFLRDLRFYPPKPAGSRYKRTFKLKRGWKTFYESIVSGFQIVVSNLVKYTRWVVGSLDTLRSSAASFQRKFHNRNGWPLAFDIVDMWFNIFMDEFDDAFDRELADFASRKTT